MNKFRINQTLKCHIAGINNLNYTATVIRRNPETIIKEKNTNITRWGVKSYKIHLNETGEYIFPYGRPVFYA